MESKQTELFIENENEEEGKGKGEEEGEGKGKGKRKKRERGGVKMGSKSKLRSASRRPVN